MAACILFFSCNRRSSKEIDLNLIRVNDSSNYVKQALEFISEVAKKELADRSMILEDKPILPDDLDCLTNAKEDSVNFTKLERDSLLQKAQASFIHFWTRLYFPNSCIVSADTVRSIFNDHNYGLTNTVATKYASAGWARNSVIQVDLFYQFKMH